MVEVLYLERPSQGAGENIQLGTLLLVVFYISPSRRLLYSGRGGSVRRLVLDQFTFAPSFSIKGKSQGPIVVVVVVAFD